MKEQNKSVINVQVIVNAGIEKVWECFTLPEHIIHWNFASDTWHSPRAENDLKVGGKFSWRMEAKDKSFGFDFSGTFTKITLNKEIAYILDDGREVSIEFIRKGSQTLVKEFFEAEEVNSPEMQKAGWQAILDNFKIYTESVSLKS
ncbi:MAG: SRPBCC domain-containing protein [Bacteroidales bacterium]|nr:SRPBCC domain-containing protein [Bacteroidales bacterium]MCB9012800.1 SRPBCC domain-containing protein [Bacteroidales bacterium]